MGLRPRQIRNRDTAGSLRLHVTLSSLRRGLGDAQLAAGAEESSLGADRAGSREEGVLRGASGTHRRRYWGAQESCGGGHPCWDGPQDCSQQGGSQDRGRGVIQVTVAEMKVRPCCLACHVSSWLCTKACGLRAALSQKTRADGTRDGGWTQRTARLPRWRWGRWVRSERTLGARRLIGGVSCFLRYRMSEGDSIGDSVHGKPSVVYRFFTRLGQVCAVGACKYLNRARAPAGLHGTESRLWLPEPLSLCREHARDLCRGRRFAGTSLFSGRASAALSSGQHGCGRGPDSALAVPSSGLTPSIRVCTCLLDPARGLCCGQRA